MKCAAADVRWRGRAEAVGRQVIGTCCFLHRPMGRDLRVGVRRGLQAVEDQRVHHSRHLAEAVALWCTAGRHNEFSRLDFLLTRTADPVSLFGVSSSSTQSEALYSTRWPAMCVSRRKNK